MKVTRKIPPDLIGKEVEGVITKVFTTTSYPPSFRVTVSVKIGEDTTLNVDTTIYGGSPGHAVLIDALEAAGKGDAVDFFEIKRWTVDMLSPVLNSTVGITLHVSDSKTGTPYCKLVSFKTTGVITENDRRLMKRIALLEQKVAVYRDRNKELERILRDYNIPFCYSSPDLPF